MDKVELKNLGIDALLEEVGSLKKELFNLKLSLISGQVKDFSQFSKLRKKTAKVLTFLNEKKQLSGNDK
jgi:ribosomal protein L29